MMSSDCDYERADVVGLDEKQKPKVNVVDDKDYLVVTIQSKDRPKLLFDTEYHIRLIDGSPVKSDTGRQKLIRCLESAIERRVSEGVKLELSATDRVGPLYDVTRIFRENNLTITRSEVRTRAGKAVDTFYVPDASGHPVDERTIDSIRQAIGQAILHVNGLS
ncbi:hypothetical protein L1049_003908 [Liquidambar formosana]|uniref:ACT domain-containing protein ACR n=1 Tax=Liquidambar formosana TaxID=63359 RepID=A0AAP0RME9_LIQFO